MKRYIFFIIIILAIFLANVIAADELYKITSKEMGFSSLDYTVTEIKRTDRLSVREARSRSPIYPCR